MIGCFWISPRTCDVMLKTNRSKLISAYVYCALHITALAIFFNSNGNEPWAETFMNICTVIFFPLWVLTFSMGRLIWGALNIFEANYIFGIFIDHAILSVISIHILIAVFIVISRFRGRVT